MREIKFRAWDGERMIGRALGADMRPPTRESGVDLPATYSAYFTSSATMLVLMQFTGLLDKNGKEIFEGDICKFNAVEIQGSGKAIKGLIGEVRWDNEDTGFSFLTNTDAFPHVKPWFAESVEIIGNIYKDAELLR